MKFLLAGDPNKEFLIQAIEKLKTIPHEAIIYDGDFFQTEICYDFLRLETFVKDNCINYLIDATNDDNPTVAKNFFSISHTLGIKSARLESPKFWHNPYMTAFPHVQAVGEALNTLSELGTTMLALKAQDIQDLSIYFDENFNYDLAPNENIKPTILLACKDGMGHINDDITNVAKLTEPTESTESANKQEQEPTAPNDHTLSKFAIVKQVQDFLPNSLENMDELYKTYNFNGLVVNDIDSPNETIVADWAIRNKIQTMCIYKENDEPIKTFFDIISLINYLNDRE